MARGRRWLVYAIAAGRKSYVGATVDVRRRLRQHNGEIKGGAKYTRLGRPGKGGGGWRLVFTVCGFPGQRAALQFEWAVKHRAAAKSALMAGAVGGAMEEKAAAAANQKKTKKKRRPQRRPARAHGRGVPGRVANLQRVLHQKMWTSKSPEAHTVPLVVRWHELAARPSHFKVPPFVSEAFGEDSEEQEAENDKAHGNDDDDGDGDGDNDGDENEGIRIR